MDRKKAAEILGVREDSAKTNIEKRYDIILKKYRRLENKAEEKENFHMINEAYNVMMEYDVPPEEEERPPKEIYNKLGLDQKKTENFIHYHKWHIIIALTIVLVVFFSIKNAINRIDPELKVTIIGEVYLENPEILRETILSEMEYIPEMGLEYILLSDSLPGDQQYAYLMKAQIQFAAETIDIFILDEFNYVKYAEMGGFKSIDIVAEQLGINKADYKSLEVKVEDSDVKDVFGIDVTDSRILKDVLSSDGKLIAAIGHRGEFPENGIEFLKLLLE